jgi:hypothetical protein
MFVPLRFLAGHAEPRTNEVMREHLGESPVSDRDYEDLLDGKCTQKVLVQTPKI